MKESPRSGRHRQSRNSARAGEGGTDSLRNSPVSGKVVRRASHQPAVRARPTSSVWQSNGTIRCWGTEVTAADVGVLVSHSGVRPTTRWAVWKNRMVERRPASRASLQITPDHGD